MKNSKVLFLDLVNRIKIKESHDEIKSIAYLVMENLFSLSKTDVLSEKVVDAAKGDEERISEIIHRINTNEPIQYILGETIFYGRKFLVNSSVLIPRPETEELVRLILNHLKLDNRRPNPRILDIGTGSGCIPVTLAVEFPKAEVSATDISDKALEVASKNASYLGAVVHFFKSDILENALPATDLDVVVSNPPYISLEEKSGMRENVVEFEPHIALFVADSDPLLFYRSIVKQASRALRSNGLLAVEINERFGKDIVSLMERGGFRDVEVNRDLFNKERIVKGIWP